jgi:uncharacterized UBP type Zn finger protein
VLYFIVSEDASEFMTTLTSTVLEEIEECRNRHAEMSSFFMKFYWMMEHQRKCNSCKGISTNQPIQGGYIFPLQFMPEHFTEQKDCTLKELFQVYQSEHKIQEYKCEKCCVRFTATQTDRMTTLPKILCAVIGWNIIHDGSEVMIMSPVEYPVDCMSSVDVTITEDAVNTDEEYKLFGVINYKPSGQENTGHYTAICKSK